MPALPDYGLRPVATAIRRKPRGAKKTAPSVEPFRLIEKGGAIAPRFPPLHLVV
jgi:hypothetical protein